MVKLPEVEAPTVSAIYKAYEKKQAQTLPRPHLGASLIGKECSRALWYEFRWCGPKEGRFTGRLLRLFETGHREEARVAANLRAIGATVYEVNPVTQKQFRYMEYGGHFGGSMDGVVLGIPEAPKTYHLLEIKTHNAKSFQELKNKGVKEAKPVHWHQMQTYMGLAELTRALYFAVHKDTDEIFVERIQFDKKILQANRIKALRILKSDDPLTKVGDSGEYFSCRWCDFKSICHENSVPPVTCRSCVHATPILEGDGARWRCERHQSERTRKEQFEACEDHLYIPALIPYAESVDSGDDWIAYQVKSRDQGFVNAGPTSFPALDVPHYLSSEIAALPSPDVIGNEAIERVRDTFDAKIVASSEEVAHVI